MFLIGSRVRVLYSSLSKGKMGPRKGSEGFIIQPLTRPFFTSTPIPFVISMNEFNFVGFTYNIQFYKYGNEKRERCEQRFFTAIIPVTTTTITDEQATTAADTFISLTLDGKLSEDGMMSDQIEKRVGKRCANFGVLQSMGCEGSAKMTLPQVRCWLKAIKRSNSIHTGFLVQRKLFERSKLCDLPLLSHFAGSTKDRWRKLLNKPYEQIRDTNMVEVHRGLMAIYNNQSMRRAYTSTNTLEHVMEWAANGLLDYPEYAKERRKIISKFKTEMGGIQSRLATSTIQMTEILAKKLIDL